MIVWNGKIAADILRKIGLRCHQEGSKTANFTITGGLPREISIVLTRENGVTAYVNRYSITEQPIGEIDGIEIVKPYRVGHKGINGNPGVAGSVVRHNPSLDPKKNEVLRVHADDEKSLSRLLDWYRSLK
jgi:hypothetical protein